MTATNKCSNFGSKMVQSHVPSIFFFLMNNRISALHKERILHKMHLANRERGTKHKCNGLHVGTYNLVFRVSW